MDKCIYLKEVEPNVTFKAGEHIIPAGIGGIRKLKNGMVSDEFNNEFSKLELDFMRYSPIAMPRETLGPGKRGSLSEKKVTKSLVHIMTVGDDFSNSNLGYITKEGPYVIPQFKIFDKDQMNLMFDQTDGSIEIQADNFINKLKTFHDKFNIVTNKNIPSDHVFIGNFEDNWYLGVNNNNINPQLKKDIDALIENFYYSNYQAELNTAHVKSHKRLEFSENNYYRVYAKIAFNFLAYIKGAEFVLDDRFDAIRNWIVNGGENLFVYNINENNKLGDITFPKNSHKIIITRDHNFLFAVICLYDDCCNVAVELCDNFTDDSYNLDGYICDWETKNEYTLDEYLLNLGN